MPHVVLLGDSIFDNGSYTRGEPDVVTHLTSLLPASWRATLRAVDGATTSDLAAQLRRVPADSSHLVVAIGGNDALQNADVLSMRVTSSAEALRLFAERVERFEQSYQHAIRTVLDTGLKTCVCTVYNGALEPERATAARLGLALFNDAILRTAIELRLDVIELRSVCTAPEDYANPIEPSGRGGRNIALAIASALGAIDSAPPSRVWAGSPRK
jgi:hypothetical protein